MGGWGSRVLNFLVKIHIQLFVLQTSSNVLKHISHKVRRPFLDACKFKLPDGTFCPSHFVTRGERNHHKIKYGHQNKRPPKETGTAKKPQKKKSRK